MKASFIIPSHNCQTWLPHAVQSCLEQTYKDHEVIIVDDASTDRTKEYLEWIAKNEKVKVLINEKNMGRSSSRNFGIKHAQGDILFVLDADDISTPNRAELTIKKFKSSDVDYVYGASTVIDILAREVMVIKPDMFKKDKALEEPFVNGIVHSSSAYNRNYINKISYRGGEISKLGLDDWAFQLEGLFSGMKFDWVPQRLCCYRQLESQISRTRNPEDVKQAKKKFLETLKVPA